MADYRSQFIEAMRPHALRVSQQTGLDPRIVIAQAAQETGWGKSAPNNNYFGIKSHGKGGGSTLSTKEFVNGQEVTINDSFRGYGSMGESADGYASFLKENPRYGNMLSAKGLDAQVRALAESGYATDPNYGNSVFNIAKSIPMEEPITMTTLSGKAPVESVMGYQWNPQTGKLERTDVPNASPPTEQMQGFGSEGVLASGPVVSTQGPQALMEDPSSPKFGQKGWLTPDRSDMLLAIGSGLLSGDDWASGIAGASNNLLAVNGGNRDEKYRQDALAAEQANASKQDDYMIPMGQVEMPDGSIRIDLVQNRRTGQVTDSRGQTVDVTGSMKINNSDVQGSKGQMTPKQAQDSSSWLINTGSTLQSMDRITSTLQDTTYGAPAILEGVDKTIRTLINKGLTQEQIVKAVASGDQQTILGGLREQVLGPGPMTEIDAGRLLLSMGGQIGDYFTNPETIIPRVTILKDNLKKDYDQRYAQYTKHNEMFPQLGYLPVDPYTPWTPPKPTNDGALDSSNTGSGYDSNEIDSLLKGMGI